MTRNFPDGKKVYFLDTSVIIHDPEAIEKLSADGNVVVILIHVLAELDKSKKFRDQAGANSRSASRLIDSYREIGMLNTGVETKSGGTVVVDHDGHEEYFTSQLSGLEKSVDNRIVATALWWKETAGERYKKVAVVSKDINLRVTASTFGLDAEDYERDKRIRQIDELYTGATEINLPDEDGTILADLPRNKTFSVGRLSIIGSKLIRDLFPNECIYLNVAGKRILAIYKKKKDELVWVKKPQKDASVEKSKIVPINDEQAFEYALLMDDEIPLVTVTGRAGSGKTLISLLAGLNQFDLTSPLYKTVMVYRPNVEIGNSLGFLPGDITQKFTPWMQPILDNLSLIIADESYEETCGKTKEISTSDAKATTVAMFMEKGLLSIDPINYIRGRSLQRAFVIIDEAQNLTPHEVKTMITRVGRSTKIVLTGDCTQVDNPYLDSVSNGLTHTVERLKGQEWAANVMLRKGERSLVAEQAALLL